MDNGVRIPKAIELLTIDEKLDDSVYQIFWSSERYLDYLRKNGCLSEVAGECSTFNAVPSVNETNNKS